MSSRTYGKTCGQAFGHRYACEVPVHDPPPADSDPIQPSVARASAISNERQLSGVEIALATVAQWPDADGREMAIYRLTCVQGKARFRKLLFRGFENRGSCRFCGQMTLTPSPPQQSLESTSLEPISDGLRRRIDSLSRERAEVAPTHLWRPHSMSYSVRSNCSTISRIVLNSDYQKASDVMCCAESCGLEIEKLVGYFFGSERVEHGHDQSGEFKVRGAAVGDENACMGALFAERGFVQPFKVAAIMGEDCSPVCGRKMQLRGIGMPEVLRFSGG